MRRKARARAGQDQEQPTDADSATTDHERFWAGTGLDGAEDADTFAGVGETDEQEVAHETLEYMGTAPRTRVDPDELIALAEWAESKACRVCRRKIHETHDPASLKHDDCRDALRVARLLHRYG